MAAAAGEERTEAYRIADLVTVHSALLAMTLGALMVGMPRRHASRRRRENPAAFGTKVLLTPFVAYTLESVFT